MVDNAFLGVGSWIAIVVTVLLFGYWIWRVWKGDRTTGKPKNGTKLSYMDAGSIVITDITD